MASYLQVIILWCICILITVNDSLHPPIAGIDGKKGVLTITNIRHENRNKIYLKGKQSLTIESNKGGLWEIRNIVDHKWIPLGQLKLLNTNLKIGFTKSEKTFSHAVVVYFLQRQYLRYANSVIEPLWDTYYVIGAHGAEYRDPQSYLKGNEALQYGINTWPYRSPVKFLVEHHVLLEDS